VSGSVLQALAAKDAFKPVARFDLLANEHVRLLELGAADVDDMLGRAIAKGSGVITVVGTSGSGKSSLIAYTAEHLPSDFVPIRISVSAATDAFASVPTFCRHCVDWLARMRFQELSEREHRAVERHVTPVESAVSTARTRGVTASLGVPIKALKTKVEANLSTQAGEQLKYVDQGGDAADALVKTLDVFTSLTPKRLPVLLIEDTDHWASTPGVADAFFDTVVRHLAKGAGIDAVVVCSAQPSYTALDGYKDIRGVLGAEIFMPVLPKPIEGLSALLQSRMTADLDDSCGVRDAFSESALTALAKTYEVDVDIRRTLNVAHSALGQAAGDGSAAILQGHIQHGMAQHPPRTSP